MRRGSGRYRDDAVDSHVHDIEPRGIVVDRAPVESAAAGGCSGFPLPSKPDDDSAWCAVIEADLPEPVGDIRHLQHLLQTNQQAEGAALLTYIVRIWIYDE
jgi:hypothetical protein